MTKFILNPVTGDLDKVRKDSSIVDICEETMWVIPPILEWWDPVAEGGLPADPDVGDRYGADATGSGWTIDYIYEWDGSTWVEESPEEGWMLWDLLGLLFWVFFSGGWMEVSPSNHSDLYDMPSSTNTDHDLRYTNRQLVQGTFKESFNCLAVARNSNTEVWATLEKSGGGDLTAQFSSGDYNIDCTGVATPSTKCEFQLNLNTTSSPVANYVYILESAPTTVVVSTTDWAELTVEHIKISYFLIPTAAYVANEGAYINQNWNDHLAGTDGMGHLTHIAERSRRDGAYYFSGIGPADGTSDDYLDIAGSTAYFKCKAGILYQMHKHTYLAKDTDPAGANDDIHVKNWSGDAFHELHDLTEIVNDSSNNTLNNKWFNIVVWGVANKGGEYSPIMINLPSAGYNNESDATNDVDGKDDFSIPREYSLDSSTGFLICRITCRQSGGTWTYGSYLDLRGKTPSTASGTSAGADHGDLGGLSGDDHTQYLLVDGTRAMGADLDMANNSVGDVDSVEFNVNGNPSYLEGAMFYDETHKCLSGYNDSADFTHNYGREITVRVRNTTGSAITNGQLVYYAATGTGHTADIALAKADAFVTQTTIGMATIDIANNGFGEVTRIGEVHDVNTNGMTVGDILYLSPTTAGAYTTTRPSTASGHFVCPIGRVVYPHATVGILDLDLIHFPIADDLYGLTGITQDITTTGTIQAEQITSTDDITMSGHLLTLGNDTANDVVIDFKGNTSDGKITWDEGSNRFLFDSYVKFEEFIAIGTANPGATSVVLAQGTVAGSNVNGFYGQINWNPSSHSGDGYAGRFQMSTNADDGINMSSVIGLSGNIILGGSNEYTITDVVGLRTYGSNPNNKVNVTNLKNFYVEASPLFAGDVTNHYGIYIDNISQGDDDNYCIYANAGVARFEDEIHLEADEKMFFGTGKDVSIEFNAYDLVINSENVTAADEVLFTNFTAYRFDNDIDTASTIRTASDDDWDLEDYHAGVQTDTGYVKVTINGTAYRLLALAD